jgi:pimeloyl-ACP methyl ester carboxylesterase
MGEPITGFVDTNGVRLHYRDWGGDGTPVVLLHGLSSNARIWDFVAPRLAGRAHVVALDQRGHGGSTRADAGYDFASVTADLAGAVDALGFERCVVVGHSWGASVAVSYAATHTDRTAAVALVDGGWSDLSLDPGMTREKAEKMLTPPRYAGIQRARLFDMIRGGELGALWNDALEAIFMAQLDVGPNDTVSPVLTFEHHMMIVRAMWDFHARDLLPSTTCPVLMIPAGKSGSEWVARKRASAEAAERITPHARTIWFEDSIHDIPLQHPERLAQVLGEFITSI